MANEAKERRAINPTLKVFLTALQFKRRNPEKASDPEASHHNPTMKIAITAAKRTVTCSKEKK